MSLRFFKKRRQSSTMSRHSDQPDEAPPLDASNGATRSREVKIGRAASVSTPAAGLSSSYSLPSRSFIHHAGHASKELPQYSYSGVREQTEQLSSSVLSDSEMGRHFSPDKISGDSGAHSRMHETIDEDAEPGSPEGARASGPGSSEITEALRRQPGPERKAGSRRMSAARTSGDRTRREIPKVIVSRSTGDSERDETTPLLPRARLPGPRKVRREVDPEVEAHADQDREPGVLGRLGQKYPFLKSASSRFSPKTWGAREIATSAVVKPAKLLPAVLLGLLLNLLDALSYGIILFPLGEEAFADLGPDGVSMFYVSCIVAQLTYSTGSIFKGGVGSEMIEVVPFFHKMTYLIMKTMGTENPDALRATVITSYAMSSIITGLVFLLLGSARLGTLVNFFPHSILTGCIGGVGIFLFITGIEVSARLDGNLEFTPAIFHRLFAGETVVLWLPPLALAILLLTIKRYFDRPWLTPSYFVLITAIFYIITAAVPSITMPELRQHGWVFEAPAAGVPFYNFYSYYKFSLVDWSAIWMTIPSQLALTFFGVLHVPINVPNLAIVVQEDNVSINRELIMHGISNTLSGCIGSIQNYEVFVNSVLFMESGGNSRLGGYMLAAATFGLWVAGPIVIGYVPVMVVGTLIYMLGIDLAQEALVATFGRLHRLEYFTIVVIALVMGVYDFVVGIAIGIGLACLVYVVQTSRKSVIRAEFSGAIAESTVRRHPRHRDYLHRVGRQIRIVKLGGYLFFGSIVKVEKKVRALIDAEAFAASPIRYLVLDFTHVTGIDFSAAEAFGRMNRIVHRRGVQMAMAGVTLSSEVGRSLAMVGLFEEPSDEASAPAPKVYEDLNCALEACENELLTIFTEKQAALPTGGSGDHSPPVPIPATPPPEQTLQTALDATFASPRRSLLDQAATTTLTETALSQHQHHNSPALPEPLPLLLQAFAEYSPHGAAFWSRLTPYLARTHFPRGTQLYAAGEPAHAFYLLASGILRAEYAFEQGSFHESIVAGTTCGELPFFSETERTCRVVAEREAVAWGLGREAWGKLQEGDGEVAREVLKVGLRLCKERMDAITGFVLIMAS